MSISNVVFNCTNASILANFWAAAMNYEKHQDTSTEVTHLQNRAEGQPNLSFFQVPEAKEAKNRLHLDLAAPDMEGQVARFVELGAKKLEIKHEYGIVWTVMQDPEGNEFCCVNKPKATEAVDVIHFTFDCTNPQTLAQFWSETLGYEKGYMAEFIAELSNPSGRGPGLLFMKVPEAKTVKNRLHLNLSVNNTSAEVARLEKLGARKLETVSKGDKTWTVMQDPEGNEFCLV